MTTAAYDLVLTGGNLLDPARASTMSGATWRSKTAKLPPSPTAFRRPGNAEHRRCRQTHHAGPHRPAWPFLPRGSGSAVHADQTCLSSGTTTGVDAGSAGFLNYGAMRDYVFPAHRTRLIAFLHIGGVGLAANGALGGGLHDMRIIDVGRTVQAIRDNPGFVFGVKVRMHYDAVARWNAHEAMAKAREAASEAGVRLMVHVSGTPIPLPDVLEHLGPGDISTHAFNGNPESILDNAGKVRPEVRDAVQRGVIMDVAHAGVHCDVEVSGRPWIRESCPIPSAPTFTSRRPAAPFT